MGRCTQHRVARGGTARAGAHGAGWHEEGQLGQVHTGSWEDSGYLPGLQLAAGDGKVILLTGFKT